MKSARLLLAGLAIAAPLRAQRTLPLARVTRDLLIDAATTDLSDVYQVVVMRDKTIAVLEWQDHAVRFFKADGTPEGSIGKNGEGPGEFRCVCQGGRIGDTLWVDDLSLRRTTFIAPDHKLLRVQPDNAAILPSSGAAGRAPYFSMRLQAINADGSQLVTLLDLEPTPRPFWIPRAMDLANADVPYLRVSRAGVFQRLVAWPTNRDHCIVVLGPQNHNITGIPFCHGRYDDVAQDGSALAHVEPVPPVRGQPTYQVTLIGARGDTQFVRQYSYTPVPIPAAVVDSARTRLEASTNRVIAAAWASGKIAMPREYPALRNVIVGRDRTAWIELRVTGDGHTWLVLDSRGNPIAQVNLPANVTVMAVERGRFWGVFTDADGLASVVRYTVSMP